MHTDAATDTTPRLPARLLAALWSFATYCYDEADAAFAPGDDRPQITCGKCRGTHHAVATVRSCYDGAEIRPCDDLVQILGEDGPMIIECGEEATWTDRGFTCSGGHSHVLCDVRRAEGWEYAEDAYDAAVIGKGGRDFVPMGPNTHIDSGEVAHIMRTL